MKKKLIAFTIMALALMVAFIPAVFAGGPWEDDFDSYPTGSSVHGVGGWKGWFNDPLAAANTTDVQARSAPNSIDIAGPADLVREFDAASGFQIFRAWQYIPGNMSGGPSYYIMQNQYDDAGVTLNWSVQVAFDPTTGLMNDEGLSGASQPYITDQWVEICLEIDLGQDTQAFYYNGAVFYTGTWSGHVSGGGIIEIGAVDLFANNATSVYYDDFYLYEGAPGGCLEPVQQASIVMTKTVGTDPAVCATTDNITVATGTDVYYCYEVTNTGDITLPLHDLDDDQLGSILSSFAFDLAPGASVDTVAAGLTLSATILADTTNTAVWTAYEADGASASYTDTATVTAVDVGIVMTKTVGTDSATCATTDNIVVDAGTDVYYCYTVTNTGEITLPLHDLVDDQLGTILDDFAFDLGPGATVDTVAAGLTLSQTIVADTTNTATWTAFEDAGLSAESTDTATVTITPPTDVSLSSFGSEANSSMWPAVALVLVLAFVGAAFVLRRREA